MPLSKRGYDKYNADPKRSEAARRGAATRARNEKRRREAISALTKHVQNRWPDGRGGTTWFPTEDAIEAWLVEHYGAGWRKA